MKDCKNCGWAKEKCDHRGCPYYACTRPGGCYDQATKEKKNPPHDPRMGIYRWDKSTW